MEFCFIIKKMYTGVTVLVWFGCFRHVIGTVLD